MFLTDENVSSCFILKKIQGCYFVFEIENWVYHSTSKFIYTNDLNTNRFPVFQTSMIDSRIIYNIYALFKIILPLISISVVQKNTMHL